LSTWLSGQLPTKVFPLAVRTSKTALMMLPSGSLIGFDDSRGPVELIYSPAVPPGGV
jgi:hypothetical protein